MSDNHSQLQIRAIIERFGDENGIPANAVSLLIAELEELFSALGGTNKAVTVGLVSPFKGMSSEEFAEAWPL